MHAIRYVAGPVKVAEVGISPTRSAVLIAPVEGWDTCSGPVVSFIDVPVKGGCGPSVDQKALAVVLSGMGDDGSEGARRLHDAGDLFFEHHELSSAVFCVPINISQQRPWESLGRMIGDHLVNVLLVGRRLVFEMGP